LQLIGVRLYSFIVKLLISIGSSISIGFGIWHFFVPKNWNWYSYIKPEATELIIAVRAINVFFSLALVLFGLMNILLVYGKPFSKYSILVVLFSTCILWIFRVLMQIIYPQGSMNQILQYGLLVTFLSVLICYIIPVVLIVKGKFG